MNQTPQTTTTNPIQSNKILKRTRAPRHLGKTDTRAITQIQPFNPQHQSTQGQIHNRKSLTSKHATESTPQSAIHYTPDMSRQPLKETNRLLIYFGLKRASKYLK
jgi:hypothetical protein